MSPLRVSTQSQSKTLRDLPQKYHPAAVDGFLRQSFTGARIAGTVLAPSSPNKIPKWGGSKKMGIPKTMILGGPIETFFLMGLFHPHHQNPQWLLRKHWHLDSFCCQASVPSRLVWAEPLAWSL